ncbi:MAG: dethiobiotin synthase [Marinifilaceae bacterium]
MPTYFVTGIDTDAGKSFATGLMAKYLQERGENITTQKFAQTGCQGISEDILAHREIMGIEPTKWDCEGTTCPYVFNYPASPHLAASLENQRIEVQRITESTNVLEENFDYLLIEGVGGIYVPINDDITLLDYVEKMKYPLILVTSSKLGSINHTLLTLEIAYKRKLPIQGVIYNHYPNDSEIILKDSIKVFRRFLDQFGYDCPIIEIPKFEKGEAPNVDFGLFFTN